MGCFLFLPAKLYACMPQVVQRVHPTVVGYTKRDIGLWSEVMARSLTATGMDNNSIIQIAYGYGLFTGGLGVHYGAELMGASVIPVSTEIRHDK